MPHSAPGRILSIQSHVAFGYVGGKAAIFPLQCLGYDVDVRSDSLTSENRTKTQVNEGDQYREFLKPCRRV